jgi:carboxylate-amine ligase
VASYDNFLETLVNTNCIDNPKFGTLASLTIPLTCICDMSLTVEETMCIVSVIQAVKLYKLNQQNVSFNIYRLALIKENKFGRHAMALRGT